MNLEEMKELRKKLGFSYAKLSELSHVPEATIQKIFSGTTANPRYDTLQALEAALTSSSADLLQDAAVKYGVTLPYDRQGTYTIADRETIPDDIRTELIDGVLYDMASPSSFHQMIAGLVHHQLLSFIEANNGSCIPFIAPMDVQLDRDEKTMVQPDVLIVCDQDIITGRNIYGAPDFVLEVISPSTSRKDHLLKLHKYENAGVKEYWIVDPYQRLVMVYFFEDAMKCPQIYPITAPIPVNVYQGEAVINLSTLEKWLP